MNKHLWMIFLTVFVLGAGLLAACGDDDDNDCDDCLSNDDAVDDDADDDTVNDDMDDDADDDAGQWVVPPVNNEPPPWARWVLLPWVWEDESTQESALALIHDYIDHDIPTAAIIIDSPWETGYNTFLFDEGMYPDAQGMIDEMHDNNVRVIMWITANVNEDSPNFQEGLNAGYYVSDGRLLHWWKGDGAFIDYWNPDALQWWHEQMDLVLDMGIDGWKTDGSEFSLIQWIWVDTANGKKTWQEYQRRYYRDFFEYTREKLGPDRMISARPVDSYGLPWAPGFADVDVNFAGWVGDQDPTFEGLRAALLNLHMSGNCGYVNFGSDIAGYRDPEGDEPRDKQLFVRWAQLGALCPIMENGGSGEHRPWMYDEEVLEIYRDFADLHVALIPYLYSQGAESYAQKISLFRPVYRRTWEYMLGDNIFVAPMTEAGTTREVRFPDEGIWIDWWDGTEHAAGSTATLNVPLARFPIFVRKGAIIPMNLQDGGVLAPADPHETNPPVTVNIWPVEGFQQFNVFEEGGRGARIFYEYGDDLRITLSANYRDYAFNVRAAQAPASVVITPGGALVAAASLETLASADTGYFHDSNAGQLWIKPGGAGEGLVVQVD